MSHTPYGYHLGGQMIANIFLFLYNVAPPPYTLLIGMITFAEELLNNCKHAFTNLTIKVPYGEHSSMLQSVIICAITGDLDNICSGRETQQTIINVLIYCE